MNNTFSEWLREQMIQRNLSQAELAKKSGLSPAQISRVLLAERGLGEHSLNSLARALQLPSEEVFRRAGLLPPKPEKTQAIEELLHLASGLPPDQVQELIDLARLKLDRAQVKIKESRLKPALRH